MALPQLFACLSHPLKEVEYDKTQVEKQGVAIAVNKDVDIIFVIDNSGSMAEEQALLSANFAAFVNVLEADDVKANYRMAITTTDNGNPRCPKADTTPEGGAFVLSSCIDRIDVGDFLFKGVDPALDASATCTDYCTKDDTALAIRPTSTDLDPTEKARPWLQNIEGETNLPNGVSTVEAFQCFGPQGISGCGFESHLESMYKALGRTDQMADPQYGFLRDQAILSIVVVSDEADCSYPEEHKAIFIDNKVFWNDMADPIPTSAVCWRAGVSCEGSGPSYTTCKSENWDEAGNPGASDADAVLHPLSRYVTALSQIESDKQDFDSGQEVLFALIGGVPPGYKTAADAIYEDSSDPVLQGDFGIGPGCTSMVGGTAVPPVRLREFAETFQVGSDPNIFSICDPDYSVALKAIADKIRDQIKPACMPQCVADKDTTTPTLEPDCKLAEEITATGQVTPVPLCEKQGNSFVPPAGSKVCHILLTDPDGATASTDDDMSMECVEEGWNLEFKIFRDGPAPAGSTLSATCILSNLPAVDCPGLGG
ncbi:MAG: VWA domain-containing protein [Nannocystaceae bacterium]